MINMFNKHGQALVEFVIILPIFLLLVFTAIDFGKIIYTKISLENTLNDAVMMYKDGKSKNTINSFVKKNNKKASIKITKNSKDYITFTINNKVQIITPGLNIALDNPYNVEVKRNTYYDK